MVPSHADRRVCVRGVLLVLLLLGSAVSAAYGSTRNVSGVLLVVRASPRGEKIGKNHDELYDVHYDIHYDTMLDALMRDVATYVRLRLASNQNVRSALFAMPTRLTATRTFEKDPRISVYLSTPSDAPTIAKILLNLFDIAVRRDSSMLLYETSRFAMKHVDWIEYLDVSLQKHA